MTLTLRYTVLCCVESCCVESCCLESCCVLSHKCSRVASSLSLRPTATHFLRPINKQSDMQQARKDKCDCSGRLSVDNHFRLDFEWGLSPRQGKGKADVRWAEARQGSHTFRVLANNKRRGREGHYAREGSLGAGDCTMVGHDRLRNPFSGSRCHPPSRLIGRADYGMRRRVMIRW